MNLEAECRYLAKTFYFGSIVNMKDGVYFYCDVYEKTMDTTQCLRCKAKALILLNRTAKGNKKLEAWMK